MTIATSAAARRALCRGVFGLLCGVNAGSAFAQNNPIQFDAPLSGWRNASLDTDPQNFQQEVHYPASDVNTPEGQSRYALIQGSVRRQDKAAASTDAPATAEPYTLIVNGVAMPLKVDADGSFSRPYSFGRGANNVEVRSPDGSERNHVQFYEAQNDRLQARIRVVLGWNSDNSDLDLHVITPDGQHCWYGDRQLKNGGALDVDVTNGYGPEIFASPTAMPGTYYVYVNYYGGSGTTAAGEAAALTVATVSVITDENTIDEKRQVFPIPMRREGELTLVGSFHYSAR